jgi:hypothetical protein
MNNRPAPVSRPLFLLIGHFMMLAQKNELSKYIQELARRSTQSESKLRQLRWSWLLHPSNSLVAELVNYLQAEKLEPTEMALEYENTLAWISLFDPAFTHRRFSHAKISFFKKIGNPEARFENLLVRHFIADRNGDERQAQGLLEMLGESFFDHPKGKSLVGAESLLESIDLLNPKNKQKTHAKVTVHLGHWEIQAHGKKLISRPLCLFIELLKTNRSISFGELLTAAFDILSYNETYHYQKIQNLISRLRILSTDFVITTRQGRIYSSIDWGQVSILAMSRHQESLKKSEILNLFLDSMEEKGAIEKCAMRISISKLKSTLVSDFSRADFERVTGFPRSTASRFLKNWLDQDILVRRGAGKATSYNFK